MIYFLSDAHLGSLAIEKGWAHQKKLIDMLEEMSKDAASITTRKNINMRLFSRS